jgi:hypothetical protein
MLLKDAGGAGAMMLLKDAGGAGVKHNEKNIRK